MAAPTALITETRKAILPLLKGDATLTALVPAGRIYAQGVPSKVTWPFIRWGTPTATPLRGSCTNGARIIGSVHAFAGPRYNGSGGLLETAEDHCGRIGAAIETAIDKQSIARSSEGRIHILLSDMQLLQDRDADSFHYFAGLSVRVIAP